MLQRLRWPVCMLTALLIMGCLAVPTAVTAAGSSDPGKKPGTAGPATTSVVKDCAWATKQVRFAAIRVKKVRKRVVNGQLPGWKLQSAIRIYKKYLRYKKKVCAPAPSGAPAPLALTEAEVTNRVDQQAASYCSTDIYCYNYGHYISGGHLACASTSTYSWSCYGYNDEYDGTYYTCDFREIVQRSGYNGITSYRDLTYGNSSGWNCYY
jgi:hypothetical protein